MFPGAEGSTIFSKQDRGSQRWRTVSKGMVVVLSHSSVHVGPLSRLSAVTLSHSSPNISCCCASRFREPCLRLLLPVRLLRRLLVLEEGVAKSNAHFICGGDCSATARTLKRFASNHQPLNSGCCQLNGPTRWSIVLLLVTWHLARCQSVW
jgi:hypothetical protein